MQISHKHPLIHDIRRMTGCCVLAIFLAATLLGISTMATAETKPSDTLHGSHHQDENKLTRCPKSPNCVNSLYKDDEKHFIKPIKANVDTDKAEKQADERIKQHRDHLLAALNNFERINISRIDENYVKVEFKSKIFGFVDDVEFLISSDKIDVKSASRVGYNDMGANRKRVEKIRSEFKRYRP